MEFLHRRVENLLDDAGQTVDLVDEQDGAVLEVRQDRGEIAGTFDRGPARDLYRNTELVRDHARERGLPHSRRTVERDVLERLVAGPWPLFVPAAPAPCLFPGVVPVVPHVP